MLEHSGPFPQLQCQPPVFQREQDIRKDLQNEQNINLAGMTTEQLEALNESFKNPENRAESIGYIQNKYGVSEERAEEIQDKAEERVDIELAERKGEATEEQLQRKQELEEDPDANITDDVIQTAARRNNVYGLNNSEGVTVHNRGVSYSKANAEYQTLPNISQEFEQMANLSLPSQPASMQAKEAPNTSVSSQSADINALSSYTYNVSFSLKISNAPSLTIILSP